MDCILKSIFALFSVTLVFAVTYLFIKKKLTESLYLLWLLIGLTTGIAGTVLATLICDSNPVNLTAKLIIISSILVGLITWLMVKLSVSATLQETRINNIAVTISIMNDADRHSLDVLHSSVQKETPDL